MVEGEICIRIKRETRLSITLWTGLLEKDGVEKKNSVIDYVRSTVP
jgi:hypothetical protein